MWPFRQSTSANLFESTDFEDLLIKKMHDQVQTGQVSIEDLEAEFEKFSAIERAEFVDNLVEILLKTARGMRRNRHKIRKGFERRLSKRWKEPLDLYEIVFEDAKEIGENFNRHFARDAVDSDDFVFQAATHLHGRCCQIGYEVMALLRAGLADGAHARWRSMHELVVVAMFLSEYGQDVAEGYLLHDSVESLKVAREAIAHGDESISDDDVDELANIVESLCKKYGNEYRSQYGWAADAIGKKSPSFAQIEESIGMEQFRSSYRLASHNVHANPKGIMFRLGNPTRQLILAGPSNAGLSEPGISASWSLFQITSALMSAKMTYVGMLCVETLRILAEKTAQAFLDVELEVQKLVEE